MRISSLIVFTRVLAWLSHHFKDVKENKIFFQILSVYNTNKQAAYMQTIMFRNSPPIYVSRQALTFYNLDK